MTAEFVCADCGSDEIREAVMVDYNTREVARLIRQSEGTDYVWCDKCDCEVRITEGRFWGVDYNTRRSEVE